MNQLNKIIKTTKETVKKSSSYRPISSLEEDFEKYEKRGFIEAISTKAVSYTHLTLPTILLV